MGVRSVLRQRRQELEISQDRLATAMREAYGAPSLTQTRIGFIERGLPPSAQEAQALAAFFGCPVNELFELSEEAV